MGYVGDRVVYDADSHVMELSDWLIGYADAATREILRPLDLGKAGALADRAVAEAERRRESGNLLTAEADPRTVLTPKGWAAHGAFDAGERSRVLDSLGFAAQWVFATFAPSQFLGTDLDLLYGGADALNRALAAFCADDPRLLAVGVVPWGDPARELECARRAIDEGCRAIQVHSHLPRGATSPTHPEHDPLWALLEERNVPAVTHIGGNGRSVQREFHDNGAAVTDWLGGGENIRSKDLLAIHQASEVFWGAMILDGVLERFPGLRGGSIEEGAMWVPAWLQRLDLAVRGFAKTEPRLAELPMRASDYARRQLRFTPFPNEPIEWMVASSSDEMYLFSSDYPHPEGTKDPVARFEATMGALDERSRDRFYRANFADLYRGTVPV